ncbi:hypothetical protein CDAR_378711 [Caerostris darwini]|uniref:Uncharacterized protein n=1 Tax=Caerostris darwini TaxID=1538125 RepID=A0AAV4MUZ4_9ARAC|nr:hypothetical protein CDAR_378711 [Caerostris darwini]
MPFMQNKGNILFQFHLGNNHRLFIIDYRRLQSAESIYDSCCTIRGYKLPETLTAPCSRTTPRACRPLNGVPNRKIGERVHDGKDGLVTRSGHPSNHPIRKGLST